MRLDQRFRPAERLRRRADFDRVFSARRRAGDAVLVVHVADNGLPFSRLGISVSKRLGNSIRRHRIRRRVREAFRRNKTLIPTGLDIVCVAKDGAGDRRTNVAESLVTLTAKAVYPPLSADRKPKTR